MWQAIAALSIDVPSKSSSRQSHTPLERKLDHGVVLKGLPANICDSHQHRVRGRTTVPVGMVLGYEITGEIVEYADPKSRS